ncbi:MAG: hypothetical protein AAF713_10975 [Pseudomonadota bacterium]
MPRVTLEPFAILVVPPLPSGPSPDGEGVAFEDQRRLDVPEPPEVASPATCAAEAGPVPEPEHDTRSEHEEPAEIAGHIEGDVAPEDQPFDPAPPPPTDSRSPGAEAERQALSQALMAVETAKQALLDDLCAAFGNAAEAALPLLADSGFAGQVAETASALAARAGLAEVRLDCHPDLAPHLAAALELVGGERHFIIAGDAGLAAGSVQFAWPDGGAALEVDALAEAATRVLRAHTDRLSERETPA